MLTVGRWSGAILTLAAALALAACDEDSGGARNCGSASALAIGESSDETIPAGDCNAYEFTPEEDGGHYIYITAISTGDAGLIEFESGADGHFCSPSEDTLSCVLLISTGDDTYANDLDAEEDYGFTLGDLSGENTTLSIIVTFGSQ
jgi:hypothetical protein